MKPGFPEGSVLKNPPAMREPRKMLVQPLGHPLKEDMATHSNIPTWRIPQTEESMGLQKSWPQLSD